MNRTLVYFLGPELIWILVLAFAGIFVSINQPITGLTHLKVVWLNWYLPSIGALLAFATLFWAPGSQWWWLLRVALTSLIGIVLVVGYICQEGSYQDIRDIGIGVGFLFFVAIGWTLTTTISLVSIFLLLVKWPLLPVLKWVLIVASLFLLYLKILETRY